MAIGSYGPELTKSTGLAPEGTVGAAETVGGNWEIAMGRPFLPEQLDTCAGLILRH